MYPYRYVDPRTGEPPEINAAHVQNPRTGTISRSAGSSGRLWNSDGSMNASDRRDAFRNISHVLDERAAGRMPTVPEFRREAGAAAPLRMHTVNSRGERVWSPHLAGAQGSAVAAEGPGRYASAGLYGGGRDDLSFAMEAHRKTAELNAALHDPTGIAIVGQEMANPVREILDFEGIFRRILPVRPVKQGEVVRYDKDPYVIAYTLSRDARTPESRVRVSYVFPTPQEIGALITLELRDLYEAGYDVMARTMDRGRQAVEFREDKVGIGFLEKAVQSRKQMVYFSTLNLAAIEAIRYQVEKNRIPGDKLLINRRELQDIVSVLSSEVDPVTNRELVLSGYLGNVLNMPVLTSAGPDGKFEVVPPGTVYCVTAPTMLGGLPIWHDLASEPVNQFNTGRAVRGWFWYMFEAPVIINNRGVSKGIKAS